MTIPSNSPNIHHAGVPAATSGGFAGWLRAALEFVLLAMVVLSPWFFASVGRLYEFALFCGVAVLMALWGALMLVQWRLSWANCPVALCLGLLFLYGVWQMTPLPRAYLAALAPGTAEVYERLLPAEAEGVAGAQQVDGLPRAPGSTISLYPHATRQNVVALLAIFLLFAVARNHLATPAALRRLAIVALINGVFLALFGLIQFFTSSPTEMYWAYDFPGSHFGPFVNRNHFAFYMNLCIGLGVGLLLSPRDRSGTVSSGRHAAGPKHTHRSGESGFGGLTELLHDPRSLWISAGLGVMLSSVPVCMSRGGTLALVASAVVCLVIALIHMRRFRKLAAISVVVVTGLGLLTWFGFDGVTRRMSTLWTGEALDDGRAFLLSHSWPIFQSFPVWGTGFGTFQHVEPLYVHTPRDVGTIYEHAHNEYLEAMIEGGVIRLALSVLIVALVIGLGYRAFREYQGEATGALALGALFGIIAASLHSFVEFGLHIPAILVLVTVVCAYLSGLGRKADAAPFTVRLFGAAPLAGAATVVLLGLVLCAQGWKELQIEQLRHAAFGLDVYEKPILEHELAFLEAASRLAPENAELRVELAQSHWDLYEQHQKAEEASSQGEPSEAARRHRTLALQQFIAARDLCPLLPVPHVRLAANVEHLQAAEDRYVYLDRARFLAPADPQLWYFRGAQELADGRTDQALASWRQSLELSDRFLARILERSAGMLDTRRMIDELLPDRPAVLLAAASQLYPGAADARRPFLEKAVLWFDQQARPPSAEQALEKATIHQQLGELPEAVAGYQTALALEPQQATWRFELAEVFYKQGQLREARQQLVLTLGQQPKHHQAKALLETVARELAE